MDRSIGDPIHRHKIVQEMKVNKKMKSRVHPVRSDRACLCPDGKTYHRKCCDGTRGAQGIGNIGSYKGYGLQSELELLL